MIFIERLVVFRITPRKAFAPSIFFISVREIPSLFIFLSIFARASFLETINAVANVKIATPIDNNVDETVMYVLTKSLYIIRKYYMSINNLQILPQYSSLYYRA